MSNRATLHTSLVLLFICTSAFGGADRKLFPRPAAIEPAVKFWRDVFTKIDTKQGYIHDEKHLDVVYETVSLSSKSSRRQNKKKIKASKRRHKKTLLTLARGKRKNLSKQEARILALWPKGVKNATLKKAANQLRFQLGQSDKFVAGLVRSGAWRPHILNNLKKMGLPREIAALPHVESSFNPKAYSRVGAAGLWQFTRSTGRRFMRVDHVVDERMDPFKASIAAARLLENNYAVTGTWPLAITAYNHGAAGMRNAAKQVGSKNIDVIIKRYRSRSFKFASRNFYTAFLAVNDIQDDYEKYFGKVKSNPPVHDDIVVLPDYISSKVLAKSLGISKKELKRKNPSLRPSVWRNTKYIPKGFKLRLEKGSVKAPKKALLKIATNKRFNKQKPDSYHRVRRGQTLSTIAARYRVRVRDIVAVNGLRSKHRIRVGQMLRLPQSGKRSRTLLAKTKSRKKPLKANKNGVYKVRRGDTLYKIAKNFGLKQKQLLAFNDIGRKKTIYPGQLLRVKAVAPVSKTSIAAKPASNVTQAPITVAKLDTQKISAPKPSPTETDTVSDNVGAGLPVTTAQKLIKPTPTEKMTTDTLPESLSTEATSDLNDHLPALTLIDKSTRDVANNPNAKTSPTNINPNFDDDQTNVKDDNVFQMAEEPKTVIANIKSTESAIPDTKIDHAAATEEIIEQEPALNADPSDYTVSNKHSIEIQAAETLGHYAEWLGLRASRLRRVNKMRYRTPLEVGKRLKLDFSKVTPEEFVKQRIAYHRSIQAAYFEQYQITGSEKHKVRRGESLWVLAKRRYKIPVWLLRQYNPDLALSKILSGTVITFPFVEQRNVGITTEQETSG